MAKGTIRASGVFGPCRHEQKHTNYGVVANENLAEVATAIMTVPRCTKYVVALLNGDIFPVGNDKPGCLICLICLMRFLLKGIPRKSLVG